MTPFIYAFRLLPCYLTGRMLEAITGGKPFIKYLQQENGNNV